jgi:hypothetical protein
VELEQLARYFRVSVLELLEEAQGNAARKGTDTNEVAPLDDRLERTYNALQEVDQELLLEFAELLARRRKRA